MKKKPDTSTASRKGFGPATGRGRFSGRYTREQDAETGGRQVTRKAAGSRRKKRGLSSGQSPGRSR